ncbi:MAG: rod shape-determining protein MreD [Candidatus Omnitrophica bacterium]|nr:rod shape-determining protein MreD [Candidatus Omnitrophota bacterium]
MRRKTRLLIYFIVLSIIEICFLEVFEMFSLKIDLFVPALVNLGLNYSIGEVLGFGFLLGFLKDLLDFYPWGINSLLYFLFTYLVYRTAKAFVIESFYLKMSVVIFISLLINAFKGLFIFYRVMPSLGIFLKITLISTFYTCVFSVIIFKTMDLICSKEKFF